MTRHTMGVDGVRKTVLLLEKEKGQHLQVDDQISHVGVNGVRKTALLLEKENG